MPTPKFDSTKQLYKAIGESIKVALGPQGANEDNRIKFRNAYNSAMATFLGGTADIEKVGALVSASRLPLEDLVGRWQVDPLAVDTRDLGRARDNAITPVVDYTKFVSSEATELGINYSDADKNKSKEDYFTGKILEKLRE